jgi:hypothetical protein
MVPGLWSLLSTTIGISVCDTSSGLVSSMFSFWRGSSPEDSKNVSTPDATTPPALATTQADALDQPAASQPNTAPGGSMIPSDALNTAEKVVEAGKSNNGLEAAHSLEGTLPRPSASSEVYVSEIQMVPTPSRVDITGAPVVELSEPTPPTRRRRISFRSFGFFYGKDTSGTVPLDDTNKGDNLERSESLKESPAQKIKSKRDARKVEKVAMVLRSFLLGPVPDIQPKAPSAPSKAAPSKQTKEKASKPPTPSKLSKANNQLLSPDQANKVIAKLRTLPVPDGPSLPGIEYAGEHVVSHAEGPIHAVCLDCTEEEADRLHFSRLSNEADTPLAVNRPTSQRASADPTVPSIASANLSSLIPVLRDIHVVTLVSSPDLGFGQPADGQGPLSGSVPSAAAVTNGMMEITGQLLALGFATSKAVFPDHAGVYPPTDRMSVLTCTFLLQGEGRTLTRI